VIIKKKSDRILTRDDLLPFFAGLQYNDGVVPQFLPERNRFSSLCEGVFPSVLRYVLLQDNVQLLSRPAL
jgi:hypothetical protein